MESGLVCPTLEIAKNELGPEGMSMKESQPSVVTTLEAGFDVTEGGWDLLEVYRNYETAEARKKELGKKGLYAWFELSLREVIE